MNNRAKDCAGSALLTMSEAADLLFDGRYLGTNPARRLRTLLRAIEKKTGRKILVEFGGNGRGKRYGVTIGTLSREFPGQVKDKRADTLDRSVSALRRDIAAEFDKAIERIEYLESRVNAMSLRMQQVRRKYLADSV